MKTSFPFSLMFAASTVLVGLAFVAGSYMANDPKPPLAQSLPSQIRSPRTSQPISGAPLQEHVQSPLPVGETGDMPTLGARLATATPTEILQISGELAAQGKAAEPGLIAALNEPLPSGVRGSIANILGRIGRDDGIQATMNAAMLEKDPARRNALISGLTAGVESPSAAGLLASVALITDDPALLAPVVETVTRLGDASVLADLADMFAEPEAVANQRVVLAQMVAGLKNRDLLPLLADMASSEQWPAELRAAAQQATLENETSGPSAILPQ